MKEASFTTFSWWMWSGTFFFGSQKHSKVFPGESGDLGKVFLGQPSLFYTLFTLFISQCNLVCLTLSVWTFMVLNFKPNIVTCCSVHNFTWSRVPCEIFKSKFNGHVRQQGWDIFFFFKKKANAYYWWRLIKSACNTENKSRGTSSIKIDKGGEWLLYELRSEQPYCRSYRHEKIFKLKNARLEK